MTSVPARIRQNSPSHFMSISSITGLVYAYNPNAGSATFSTASWANAGVYVSSINRAGALLKDIGKNIVSSNRYFRKVQLVVQNAPPGVPLAGASTFGVAGQNLGTFPNGDYLTGYIELGYEGGGAATPVVQFGTI